MKATNGKIKLYNETKTFEPMETVGVYEVMIYGANKLMKGECGMAIFGEFERLTSSKIRYTATVVTDATREICHSPEDEFLDDLRCLKNGTIDWQY